MYSHSIQIKELGPELAPRHLSINVGQLAGGAVSLLPNLFSLALAELRWCWSVGWAGAAWSRCLRCRAEGGPVIMSASHSKMNVSRIRW